MIDFAKAFFVLGIVWALQGCSASQTNGEKSEAQVMQSMQRIWNHASGYREAELRTGAFKTLVIGQSSQAAANALKELGVIGIIPLQQRRVATNVAELELLKDAPAIRLGPGICVFVFDGDRVSDRSVAYYHVPNHEALRAATTRQEVYRLLGKIVGPTMHDEVTTTDPTAVPLSLSEASPEDITKFSRFTQWEAAFNDDEGYWGVQLEFVEGRLAKISTRFSKLEPL